MTVSGAIAANGGITFDASTDTVGAFTAGGTIAMGAQALTGTTGIIDYTNFDVDASGNVDIGGTITAGSGNTAVTLSTGKIDADALTLVTVAAGDATTNSVSGFETASDGLTLIRGCAEGGILEWTDAAGWTCGVDDNSGGSTAWQNIGDAASNGAIAFASTTQTMDWATMDANASFFTYNFTNVGTSAGTDSGVVINNAVSTNTTNDLNTENLLLVQQLDTTTSGTTVVDNGIKIDVAANSGMADGIEITNSAGNLTNGINVVDTAGGTLTTGILMSGTFTNLLDTDSIDISGAGAITGATGVSSTTLTASGAIAANGESITFDGATLVINGGGAVDIQDSLNADSITSDAGVSIAAGSSYTGAGAVTLSSAAGANNLTIDSGTVGSILIGTNVNAKTITIGNAADDTFSINSSGLNVTSAGALTGVASIDTIATSATALTFAGAGTIKSTTSSAITLDSGTTGIVNIGTGTSGKTINIGSDDTTADTLVIGSAKDTTTVRGATLNIGNAADNVSITDANWSITGAGALTVASCVGCGGSTTLSLASNHAISSTTATEVTGLGPLTLGTGTYVFRFSIIDTTATGTVSPAYAVNFTGTAAVRKMTLSYPSTGTTAISGVADDIGATTGQIMETVPVTAFATTAPNMLHTGGQTVTNNVHKFIDGIMIVTAGGDLELWHGSETGTATTTVAGTSVVVTKIGAGSDLAEIYGTKDPSIDAGDVVSLDSSMNAGVKKSEKAYDPHTFGVISTSPSLVMGTLDDPGTDPVLVAFSGRVPVKVNTENGPIEFGDLLTPSSTPGVAMRATKAGQVIGQAMTEFNGEGVGKVMAFIKMDYGNGAKLADMLPGINGVGNQPSANDIGKTALAQFVEQKEQLSSQADLSEIVTDRLAAAAEVITPQVTTQAITLETIQALDNEVTLTLGEDGKFVIANKDTGEETITFDNDGNATFAGTITADIIKARQIEGMDVFTDQIHTLSERVASLRDDTTASPSPEATVKPNPSASPTIVTDSVADGVALVTSPEPSPTATPTATPTPLPETVSFKEIRFEVGEMVDAKILGTLTVSGVLKVNGTAEFAGDVMLAGRTEFGGNVVFEKDAAFNGHSTFGKDTGGRVQVPKDTDHVAIAFENEYQQIPVVNVTPVLVQDEKEFLQSGYSYAVSQQTKKGFVIVLNKPAGQDLTFSWIALGVQQDETITEGPASPTPEPTSSPPAEASQTE